MVQQNANQLISLRYIMKQISASTKHEQHFKVAMQEQHQKHVREDRASRRARGAPRPPDPGVRGARPQPQMLRRPPHRVPAAPRGRLPGDHPPPRPEVLCGATRNDQEAPPQAPTQRSP